MIGNPFLSVELEATDAVKEVTKRRMRTFVLLRGTLSLTEWSMLSNSTHEILCEVVEEIYGRTSDKNND